MFRNYLKMAWRVLGRRKFFTFVSLFGISFTMTGLLVAVAIIGLTSALAVPVLQDATDKARRNAILTDGRVLYDAFTLDDIPAG